MPQRIRNLVVTVALGAALAVALPVPSEAAVLREGSLPVLDVWERAWDWLARLVAPGEEARWEKQGGAIDPNGTPKPGSAAPAPETSTSEEGGAIDPNGAK